MSKQSTSHLFMIEPESFYVNEQTAFTNHYQKKALFYEGFFIAQNKVLMRAMQKLYKYLVEILKN